MFIPENTARKVQIHSGNSSPKLLDLVAANQLEEKYGGSAKNKEEGEFWPVNLPDQDFGVDPNQTAKTYDDNFVD